MERIAFLLWTMAERIFKIYEMAGYRLLKKVFCALTSDADMENISIDSTCVKVHQRLGKKRLIKLLGTPEVVILVAITQLGVVMRILLPSF